MKFPKPNKKNIGLYVLGLIVIAAIGYAIYQPIAIRKDRDRFAKAEASFDEFVQKVEAKIGKADQVARDNSCGRANLKASEGPLLCNTNIYLLYTSKNSEEANNLTNMASSLSSSSLRRGPGGSTDRKFVPKPDNSPEQTYYQDYSNFESLSCNVIYTYPHDTDLMEVLEFSTPENLLIGLSCGGEARAEYYPVED